MDYNLIYKIINKLGGYSELKSENIKDCKSKIHAENKLAEFVKNKIGRTKVSRVKIISINIIN